MRAHTRVHMYILRACTCTHKYTDTHTYSLTNILWTEELDRPAAGNELSQLRKHTEKWSSNNY